MSSSSLLPPADLTHQIVMSNPAAQFAVDANGRLQFLNPAWATITGFDPAECLGRSCREFVHPDDQVRLNKRLLGLISGQDTSTTGEYRAQCRNGSYRWVEVQTQALTSPDGHVVQLFGTVTDLSRRKRAEDLSQGEQAVLEAMANGATQQILLDQICLLYEDLIAGSCCSILLLDESGQRLRSGAGPSLPPAYNEAVDGIHTGPDAGSCGTAAHTGEPVIVTDIGTDHRWSGFRSLALSHGLQACWSFPVMVDGTVYGTFAIYHPVPHAPDEWELELARRLSRLAAIVARKAQGERALQRSVQRHTLIVEGASVGIWEMDFQRPSMFTSPLYRTMVGLDQEDEASITWAYPEESLPAYLLERMHPEDRDRTTAVMRRHLDGFGHYNAQYRLLQPDGQYRWFHAKGQAIWDEKGQPVLMAGSLYDITDQMMAMERLRLSEQRFRDFAETASDWFWESDADHRLSFISERGLERFGLSPADILGRLPTEIVEEDTTAPRWAKHAEDLRLHRPIRNFEFGFRTADGDIRHFRINGKPMFSKDGLFLGHRGTGTDITAERQTLAALMDREQQLSDAQRIAKLGNWRWQVGTTEVVWSDEVFRIFGFDRDTFQPTIDNWHARIVPEDRDRMVEALNRCVSEQSTFETEYRFCLPHGEERIMWAESRCELSKSGEVTHVFGICQDVTDRVRQQQALERRERELQKAQQIAGTGHWRLLVDTGRLEWSTGTHDLMGSQPGYSPTIDEYMARVHHEDRDGLAEHLRRTITDRQPGQREFRIRTLTGEERVHWVDGELEFDSTGGVTAVFGIVQDVTEQRRMQERLKIAKEEAEAANRAKTIFLTSMSHELRTPLNAIIGFSDLISQEALGPVGQVQYREYAEDIHASGRHLLSLINDVLDTARIDAGQIALQEELVEVERLAGEVIRLLQHQAEPAGLTVALTLPSPAPVIRGDHRRLRQVLLNLLGNAIKFTPPGGTIRIIVEVKPATVDITVIDTGIGIPPDRIPNLGQPFVQIADNVLARQHQGSGMGLHISRVLVELHGGSLKLESKPGAGTQVTVSLPIDRIMNIKAH